jgi:hypothetical protein
LDVLTVYIGLKGFRGLIFGEILGLLQIFPGYFYGRAESVRIKTI